MGKIICAERTLEETKIKESDRRALVRILYPTIDFDLLFYPDCDNEELLDEMGIPTHTHGVFPYIITQDDDFREYLYNACREWRKMKVEEYKKQDNDKEQDKGA